MEMNKTYRLTRREDFSHIYRHRKSTANHQFVVYYKKDHRNEHFRLGVSISKKVGNAVVRNLLKRRVKEIVWSMKEEIKPGYDFILIVRKPATEQDFHAMKKSVHHVLKRAGIIKR